MPALTVGAHAPDFKLTRLDGKAFSLQEGLARGPVVWHFSRSLVLPANTLSPFTSVFFRPIKTST